MYLGLCFAMCSFVSTFVSVNCCSCSCANLCVSQRVCVGGVGVSPRIHIQLFPSDHGQGALPTHLHPSSSFPKTLNVDVSLLAMPLGTGPDLLPRTSGLGICKHLEGPTQQPPTQSLISWQAQAGHPPVWGVRTEHSLESSGPCGSWGQEIPALSA